MGWFRPTIEPKVPLRRLLRVRGFSGVRDSARVGAAVVAADALRAGAGDPACLGKCDMALRAAVRAPGAALGEPHERPLHKPVWPPEAVHTRRGGVDHRLHLYYLTLGGHRVAPRRPWLVQAQGHGCVRVWRILDVANNMTQGPCRALLADLTGNPP
jgi:hypothetical protein